MPRDLATLKDKLWETFEDATARHPKYEDCNASGSSTPFNPKTESRKAIAELAQAILAVEHEIAIMALIEDAKKNGAQLAIEINQGLNKDVKPLSSIKLKLPGA